MGDTEGSYRRDLFFAAAPPSFELEGAHFFLAYPLRKYWNSRTERLAKFCTVTYIVSCPVWWDFLVVGDTRELIQTGFS